MAISDMQVTQSLISHLCTRHVVTRELQRGPRALLRVPIITSFRMRRDRDADRPTIEVWGSVVSSPSGVPENEFYTYLRSERSHLEQSFQYFRAMAGLPNVAGPGKTFLPFPTGLRCTKFVFDSFENGKRPLS